MKAFLQSNRVKTSRNSTNLLGASTLTTAAAFHVLQLTQNAFLAHSSPQLTAASKKAQGMGHFRLQLDRETWRTQTKEMNKHGHPIFFV